MFKLRLSGKDIGAELLGLLGEVMRSLARGLGRMLAIILCGALIGVVAGAVFAISQAAPMLQSLALGGLAGACIALAGIILVTFLQSW